MIRSGGILGVHEVLFGYDNELLRLRHESINRKAFGSGALFAAKALMKKRKGFYKMEDLLAPYFASPK
jgi:4-hydroxy-tetrahydrodipicolinate reductase